MTRASPCQTPLSSAGASILPGVRLPEKLVHPTNVNETASRRRLALRANVVRMLCDPQQREIVDAGMAGATVITRMIFGIRVLSWRKMPQSPNLTPLERKYNNLTRDSGIIGRTPRAPSPFARRTPVDTGTLRWPGLRHPRRRCVPPQGGGLREESLLPDPARRRS